MPAIERRDSDVIVTFHLPGAAKQVVGPAAAALSPKEQACVDLTAAFLGAGIDADLAQTGAKLVLAGVGGGTLDVSESPKWFQALPPAGWRALQNYVRATHGGGGIHTAWLEGMAMSAQTIQGLNELEDLEHLHVVLRPQDETEPQFLAAPAVQVMDLTGVRRNARLRDVHVKCRRPNTPWMLLVPNNVAVHGSTVMSGPKIKVQAVRDDGTPDGDPLPLDGQSYCSNPNDALAEQGVTLRDCTLEQYLRARTDVAEGKLNCRVPFKMDGQVLQKSTSKNRGKIVCRHLVTRWLLDRKAHHQAKKQARQPREGAPPAAAAGPPMKKGFSFSNYRSKEALAEHVPYSFNAAHTHIRRATPEVVCHVERLGESVAQLFKGMECGEVALFAIETELHALACELQVKEEQTDAGPRKRFVFSFYDPNATATQVRMSSMDADSFKDLTFAKLVGTANDQRYCGGEATEPAARSLKLCRVFDLAADGTEHRRMRPAQTLLAKSTEGSLAYLRQCIEANRHEQVSDYVRGVFEQWRQQPPPRKVAELVACLDLSRPPKGDLIKSHSLDRAAVRGYWEALGTYADEILKGAEAVGLPVKAIRQLLPTDALGWVFDALQHDDVAGPGQSVYSYLRPVLDSDVLPIRQKLKYVKGLDFRGWKRKTLADVGLKAVPTGHGELRPRAAEAVGAMLVSILECKATNREKAAWIAALGKPPEAILQAMHEEVQANPLSSAKEWLDRAVARITPEIFGERASPLLLKLQQAA